jgi:hypothetical protein
VLEGRGSVVTRNAKLLWVAIAALDLAAVVFLLAIGKEAAW